MPRSLLPQGKTPFEHQYLNGRCDALAIALSAYYNAPIHVLYPVHVLHTGGHRHSLDFLHAYVWQDGAAIDARGKRDVTSLREDFTPLLNALKKPADHMMVFEEKVFENADDFLRRGGCSPAHIVSALEDAQQPFNLDGHQVSVARLKLVELQHWYETEEDPGLFIY